MRDCPRCGESSEDRSRFCWSCGAALTAETREARKVVTVLFCDIVGSTALSDRRDPELQHWVMSRYFDAMREIIDRHGGTVAKFIGDAVMGVFGTPVLHEDDALRAVRAAAAMQKALSGLNDELERSVDVRVRVRIGINTGEAIVGDPSRSDTMVTGDTANIASRLETSAGPGEVLLGETTYALSREAIRAEEISPLTVKGKEERLRAYRLIEVLPPRPRTPLAGSEFVGRERELALIEETLARTARSRSCHLLTVLGHPGVGKSRLVGEALRRARVRALEGACLPYGEGTTFWPLAEMGLSNLLEEGGTPRRAEERFPTVRARLEAMAREAPLAVVFDDIQWAEATLLDLIEHVADWSRDAPLLLICVARPELLEKRPGWGGGKPNAASMLLDPLDEDESALLIERRLGAAELPDTVRRRVLEAAEGFPLFVEEMVSMLVEDGGVAADEPVPIPATINLLLASRIDRLPADERDVLERAAVEGGTFHRAALAHLADAHDPDALDRILERLARKELIAPGGATYRFRHVLIRDAAYESVPKRARAELHERFAAWLAQAGDEAQEELIGYHLEQAFRYRRELRRPEPEDLRLAERAARHLEAAGSRARTRGDGSGAAKLLRRAVALYGEVGQAPPETLIALGSVLMETGDLADGDASFVAAMDAASAQGDERLATWAAIERGHLRLQVDPAYVCEDLLAVAEEATATFEAMQDEGGLATALMRVAEAHWFRCRLATTEEVLEQALVHASRAGDRRLVLEILELLGRAIVIGPRPVDEGRRRCREILDLARDEPRLDAWTRSMLAVLEAMSGRAEEARELYTESQRGLAELGLVLPLSGARMYAGIAELVLGDAQAAEREFRHGCDLLEEIGEQATLSTMLGLLAWALADQGRFEESEPPAIGCERTAAEDDVASQVLWRAGLARVLAHRGELDRAEPLAEEAVRLSESADFINIRADLLVSLASIRRAAGREDADAAAAEGLALYEAKGNVASAARARDRLRQPSATGRRDS